MGVPKLPKLKLPQLWGPITLCANLWLRWDLKQSFNPHQELSNGMSTTFTQGNWVDSRLLVVGNQTANLTPDPSFGHNLCFKCPNGSCKPTLDIYVPRDFQWYKGLSNPMGFGPLEIVFWKFRTPPGLQLPKWELTWECECSFPHTLLHSQPHGSMKCDSWASFLACTFVSLCLGRKPKARVATHNILGHWIFFITCNKT
jgi:hypothetical protein